MKLYMIVVIKVLQVIHLTSNGYSEPIEIPLDGVIYNAATKEMFKLQKVTIRKLSFSKYLVHTEPLFNHFDFLKVDDIYKLILKFSLTIAIIIFQIIFI